ncbi:MAG TPA: GNAT family N-acetyltransferase [Geobacteraceae bacterium]|nr:GNAT family N-acetyltransferase [Geobacteraceae bacterium]
MELIPFNRSHFESFLCAAKAEGWITDQREIEFLLAAYPEGCLVFLDVSQPVGFITAILYAKSAWIGNLLVLPEYRGRGGGRLLMQRVLDCLDLSGCETVWLTASADGAHLYRALGFKQIDRVQRWKGFGTALGRGMNCFDFAAVATVDCLGWGDNRHAIFEALPENCCSVTAQDGFMVCTPGADGLHIGPWGAVSREAATALLGVALAGDGPGGTLYLDSPENNRAASEILLSSGFTVAGSTLLMYRGQEPEYRPEYIYSLASMGSYG